MTTISAARWPRRTGFIWPASTTTSPSRLWIQPRDPVGEKGYEGDEPGDGARGADVDTTVSLLDMFPTLTELDMQAGDNRAFVE